MSIQKITVCASCYSVGITLSDCVCTYQHNYPTVELEFEVCDCCGNVKNDGNPTDTEFNDQQYKMLHKQGLGR